MISSYLDLLIVLSVGAILLYSSSKPLLRKITELFKRKEGI